MSMSTQLELDLQIVPTIAMRRGESYVVQCSWCGTLICVPGGKRTEPRHLRGCPACDPPDTYKQTWWGASIPVGPFRHANPEEQA